MNNTNRAKTEIRHIYFCKQLHDEIECNDKEMFPI